ncbi:MAG: hypothetical protein Q9221_007543, partial [Calogaya cf. arnoldii]
DQPHTLYPKEAMKLVCNVNEPRPFLIDFASRISDIFIAEGFMPAMKPRTDRLTDRLRTSIMHTKYLTTNVRSKRLNFGWAPLFDASDLHTEYKDCTWTTEFPLERMCITEFGLRDVWKNENFVRTEVKDIASVPLPGVSQHVVSGEDPDEYHVNRWYEKRPRTSVRIPSTPPPTPEDFEDAWLFYGEDQLRR